MVRAEPILAADSCSKAYITVCQYCSWMIRCFHDPPGLPEDNDCHYRAYSPIPIESRTPPRYLGSSSMLAANYSTDPPRGLEALDFLSSNPALNPTMHNYRYVPRFQCM